MDAIDFFKTDWILMMDPDTLVRGKLSIPFNSKLLGSRTNVGLPEEYKKILSRVPGSITINVWGASPCFFEVNTFVKAYKFINQRWELFDKFCLSSTRKYKVVFLFDPVIQILYFYSPR